jgi:hypothetical protein
MVRARSSNDGANDVDSASVLRLRGAEGLAGILR